MPVRVLIVEHSEHDALLYVETLERSGLEIEKLRVDEEHALRAALAGASWDVVLCGDTGLAFDGRSAAAVASESAADVPLIVVSSTADQPAVLAAMRAGASDFIAKPADPAELVACVERALRPPRHAGNARSLERELGTIAHDFNNLLTVISTSAELLLERLPAADSLRVDVKNIHGAAHQARDVVRQLVAFSRKSPDLHSPEPAEAVAGERDAPSSRPSQPAGDETILLVDDEELVRRAAARVLRAAGYTVLEANSGAAAIAVCEHFDGPIDLVLTDLVMPGISGPQLATWLRMTRASARVMFTSGSIGDMSAAEGDDSSADILPKPFTTSSLLKKVRATLDKVASSPI